MADPKRHMTVPEIVRMKSEGRRIVVLTAYDFLLGQILDESGVDIVLVGDTVAHVVQGRRSTLAVTMEQMLYHTEMVRRAVSRAMVVGDMPFLSYQPGPSVAIQNAGRFLKEAGCDAVKLEGGVRSAEIIRALVQADIPVMGHVGLTPQSELRLGGYRVQRNEPELLADARAVQEAGAFAVVLECIRAEIAGKITRMLSIPTIGIGAGPECDGQVLVTYDLLGLYDAFRPKYVKRYAELGAEIRRAVGQYCEEVRGGRFPTGEQSFR